MLEQNAFAGFGVPPTYKYLDGSPRQVLMTWGNPCQTRQVMHA